MTLAAGTRIGPFEVVDLLGAGGMGAVYRAYDPRLRREVALKVLPPAFSSDPDRLRRFEQEALAVARLAHPNILAVHDIGTHDDAPYMVTELLEGETLRKKMNGQPLPVRRAVEYAIQIGRGLAAAHEQGIVHRDIKPDNVFVTRDGRLKVLDFGLAKLTDVDTVSGAAAATLTVHSFGPLGTAAYMSPEQARGVRADHRADLFSVGVVLYEMVSGMSPFRRDTAAEMMTAVLREEPPDLPDAVAGPPALNRILRHCLEKDPALRFQSARDLVFDLEGIAEAMHVPARPAGRRFANPAALAVVAAAVLAMVAAGGVVIGRWTATPERSLGVTSIHSLTDLSGLEEFPAMSPDLKSVAFTARVNGYRQIFVRLLASGRPVQITKDAIDHELPRWSPDASSLFYFSSALPGAVQGTIWEIPALGGAPRRVIESVGGGDVGSDGRIACFRLAGGQVELVTAPADGSDVRVVARFAEPVYFKYPRWSRDAKWIAFQRGDGVRWDVFAVPVNGGDPRQVTHDNAQIHGLAWLPDSTGIVYSSSRSTTMAYLPTLALWHVGLEGGEPRRIAPADVSYLHPDSHASGAMVASRLHMQFDLWRYPTDGSPEDNMRGAIRITRQTGQVQTPTVGASDGEIAFLSDSGGHSNIWITAVETGELRQITYERDPTTTLGVPIWSPDGKWIAFVSSRGDVGLGFGVWIVSPDGGNLQNVVPRGLGFAWSPDAKWIYYADAGTAYKAPTTGGPAVRVREGPVRNVVAVDGTTLYFMIDRTLTDGRPGFEIHAATPEDGPSRVLAHIPASRAPQWQIINPSLSPDGQWLAMPLTDGATTNIWTLSTSNLRWRQITDFGERATFIARRVSWSADGRSILAAVGEGDADIVTLETHVR
ncbi:MAG TPA: protein kinase [Vicinamibacterales bacterium]|nr:protein kinase [Vicinamibacterales bacterium]